FRRRGPAREPRLRRRKRVGQVALDHDAVARGRERRGDELRQREFARAVTLERECQAGDRAGYADAEAGVARLARIGLAFLVEEDVAAPPRRRRLAVVDG